MLSLFLNSAAFENQFPYLCQKNENLRNKPESWTHIFLCSVLSVSYKVIHDSRCTSSMKFTVNSICPQLYGAIMDIKPHVGLRYTC